MREKIWNALTKDIPFSLGQTTFFRRVIDGKTLLAFRNWHSSASVIASWYPDHDDVNAILERIWRNRRHYRKPYGLNIEIVKSMTEAMPPELCQPNGAKLVTLTCENEKTREIRDIGLLTNFKTKKNTLVCLNPETGPWHIYAAIEHFNLGELPHE